MEKTIEGLGGIFKIKVERTFKDFLGCKMHEDSECITIGQTRIINKLNLIEPIEVQKEMWVPPSALGFFVFRQQYKHKMIKDGIQNCFCSVSGRLLYLVKLSRPDLANPVREPSKVMDRATPAHKKELKRLV
jgi:hypothetical protein